MWIPKTDEELKVDIKQREKTARYCGMLIFFLIPVFELVQNKFFGTQAYRGASFGPTLSWVQIFNMMPGMLCISSIGGILFYLALRKYNINTTKLCPKCGKLKRFNKVENCECGGKFRLLNELKWIDNNEPEQ